MLTVNVGPATPSTSTGPLDVPVGTAAIMAVSFHETTLPETPLKVTPPGFDPNPLPLIVTSVPACPAVGEIPEIVKCSVETVNCTPLLVTPSEPSVRVTGPDVAFWGTVAVTLFVLQELVLATVPLNLTMLDPWLAPKPEPMSVTEPPTASEFGARLFMTGVICDAIVKYIALLAFRVGPTRTAIGPVTAPDGIVTLMDVSLHEFTGTCMSLRTT